MKKRFFFLLPLLLILLACPCQAETPDTIPQELYEDLPKPITDILPDTVSEKWKEGDPVGAAEMLDAAFLFDTFHSSLDSAITESTASLATLIGTVFLAAFLNAFSDTTGEATGKAIRFVSSFSVLLSVFRVVKPAWKWTNDTLRAMGLLIRGILPAMTGLYAASGSFSSSAIQTTWLTLLLTVIEQLCETILSPLFGICFGLVLVTAISRFAEAPEMSGMVGSIRQLFTLFLSLAGAALSAVMTYQSVVAKSADTVLLRSIKFASGNMIPVVGGALSEAAGHYLTSLSTIRSAAGTLITVSLLLFVLPTFLKLLVCRAGFTVASLLAGLLGCPPEHNTIQEAAGLLDLALALMAICSVMFLLMIGIFVSTAISL